MACERAKPTYYKITRKEKNRVHDCCMTYTVVIFLGSFVKLRKATTSFIKSLYVRPSASAPTGQIFINFFWNIFKFCRKIFKFRYNRIRIAGTLHEDQFIFLIKSHSVLIRIRNVSDRSCRENPNRHLKLGNFFSKSLTLVR